MVIPGHNLGNSQVSVNKTIDPTLVQYFCLKLCEVKSLASHLKIARSSVTDVFTCGH